MINVIKRLIGTLEIRGCIMNRYRGIDEVFAFHNLTGSLPKLSAWEEVELYRKFNNGHLPTDPLHTPWRNTNHGRIKLSSVAARVLEC